MMRIYCPKCHSGYEIDPSLIPESGKKLRCGTCGSIFFAGRDDLLPQPDFEQIKQDVQAAAEQNPDSPESTAVPAEDLTTETEKTPAPEEEMQAIFQRLSAETEDLFKAEKELPLWRRFSLKFKRAFGLESRLARWFWSILTVALLFLAAFAFRFEIVRFIPWSEPVYALFGVDAVIPGEGLTFQNIQWNKYEVDYVDNLEVKGFVVNPTSRELPLPAIHVELLDSEGQILQQLDQLPSLTTLKPGSRVAIAVIIKKPALSTKYVILTFRKRQTMI